MTLALAQPTTQPPRQTRRGILNKLICTYGNRQNYHYITPQDAIAYNGKLYCPQHPDKELHRRVGNTTHRNAQYQLQLSPNCTVTIHQINQNKPANNPTCPFCQSPSIKQGVKRYRNTNHQAYKCKNPNCQKYFHIAITRTNTKESF